MGSYMGVRISYWWCPLGCLGTRGVHTVRTILEHRLQESYMDWNRYRSTRFSEYLLPVWIHRRSCLHWSECCASRNRGVAGSAAVGVCSICLGIAAMLGLLSQRCLADSLVRSDDTVVSIAVARRYEIVSWYIVVQ